MTTIPLNTQEDIILFFEKKKRRNLLIISVSLISFFLYLCWANYFLGVLKTETGMILGNDGNFLEKIISATILLILICIIFLVSELWLVIAMPKSVFVSMFNLENVNLDKYCLHFFERVRLRTTDPDLCETVEMVNLRSFCEQLKKE